MLQLDMKLVERIHGLNLLCGAKDLNLEIREVDGDWPNDMYRQVKGAFKSGAVKSA